MKAYAVLAVGVVMASGTVPAFAQTQSVSSPSNNERSAGPSGDKVQEKPAPAPPRFDGYKVIDNISELLAKKQVKEAEQELQAAISQHPENYTLYFGHEKISDFLVSANRSEEALVHLQANVDYWIGEVAKKIELMELFAEQLGKLVDVSVRVGGLSRVEASLADCERRVQRVEGTKENPLAAIAVQRSLQTGRAGRVQDARTLLEQSTADAIKFVEQHPADAAGIIRASALLKGQVNLETIVAERSPSEAWSRLLDFLFKYAKTLSTNEIVMRRFWTQHILRARLLVYRDPGAAAVLLDRVESFAEYKIPDIDEAIKRSRGGSGPPGLPHSQIVQVRILIRTSRQMHAQIGKPAAYPDAAIAWANANGELTATSLKGKVVLLDFFAVWCGPCIATFPHLKRWQADYSDQGLQIIGLSEYHRYGWDDEQGHSTKIDGITPEQELEGMEHFAAHHQLNYPIGLCADNQLQKHYFVNGIPHVVLIDRHGNMRWFCIGATAENATDLEHAIKECLKEAADSE